jgi:hypothetical protein
MCIEHAGYSYILMMMNSPITNDALLGVNGRFWFSTSVSVHIQTNTPREEYFFDGFLFFRSDVQTGALR